MRSRLRPFQHLRSQRRSLRNCLSGIALALAAVAAARCGWADEPAKTNSAVPTPATARQSAATATTVAWIHRLGDDHFEAREEASRHLSQMGIEIEPELTTALHNPDPEIRVRVRRVLTTILKADLERRLTAFAEDVNDSKHYDLPGWSRYRQVVGSTPAARRLFVEMQRAEPNLFHAVDEGPTAAASALESCYTQEIMQIQQMQIQMQMGRRTSGVNMMSLGAVNAMLFVGSDKTVVIGEDFAMQLANLPNQPAIQQAVNVGTQAAPVKKILGAWVARDFGGNALSQNMWLAMRFDLKEAIEPATNALRQGNQPCQTKQLALMVIGKLGDKTNLPIVESCMKDTESWPPQGMVVNNQQFQAQVRDVALAVLIHLHGKNPKEFGFDRLDLTNGFPYYNPAMIGFRTAAERDAATKKWGDWVAAHQVMTHDSTQTKKS